MRRNRYVALLFGCAALMAGVVGCGGDDGGGGGGAATDDTDQTAGAKVIDPASMDNASGEITYCLGKDTTGFLKTTVADFSKAYPNITLKTVEFPPSADEQRNQFIQRQQAKSPECDVFSSDVIWTAEFASQKWLYDLTPYIESRRDEFLEAPLETITYEDKVWGVAGHVRRRLPLHPHGPRSARRRPPGSRSTSWPRPRAACSSRARRTRG